MEKKKLNNSPERWELSNSRTFMDFLDEEALQYFPGKDDWRKRLCYTMLLWAEKSTSLDIVQFYIAYKIPKHTMWDWCVKYPDIAAAYKQMKYILGCNRRVGTMTKKLDGNFAYKDMHILDDEWDGINKYNASLKQDTLLPDTVRVEIEKITSCDVPINKIE